MTAKYNYQRIFTPRGVFIYPWLNEPDTKFKKEGEYKTKFALDPKAPGFDEFVAKIDAELERWLEANPKELKPAIIKKANRADIFEDELDEEGEETGRVLFNFKLAAKIVTAKDTWEQKVKLFDAEPKQIDVKVWSGSEGKCDLELFPYYMASTKTLGVSLRIKGAQILKLVSGDDRDEGTGGFGAESDGFVSDGAAPSDTGGGFAPEEDDEDF